MPFIQSACNKIASVISIKTDTSLARVNFTIHTYRLLCNRMCAIPFQLILSIIPLCLFRFMLFLTFSNDNACVVVCIFLCLPFVNMSFRIIIRRLIQCVWVCAAHLQCTKENLLADQLYWCHNLLSRTFHCTLFYFALICQRDSW